MSDTSQPLDHPATRSTVEGNFQSNEGNLGRILDPVRAAALHEAVEIVSLWPEDRLHVRKIIEVARAFEDYLAGDDA